MNVLHLDLPTLVPAEPKSHAAPRAEFHGGTEEEIRHLFANDREAAAQRLQEIDDEWSIEGIFEGSAAILGMASLALGLAVDDRWLVLPLAMSVLLLQQTIQGWCPLLPFMRGLGFRTEREIQCERQVLQQLEEDHAECHCLGGARPLGRSAPPRQQAHHLAAAPSPAAGFSLRDFLVETAR